MNREILIFQGVRIAGTGSYLPSQIMTNEEIIKETGLKMTSEQIYKAIGIRERRVAGPKERCSDMIFEAATKAMEAAKIKASDLDLILTSPVPGDGVTPETACVVRGLLEADCPAFDIRMACTGWIAAVQTALFYLCNGGLGRILVAAATILSWEKNWGNPLHRTIFGDAAAAVVLEKTNKAGLTWFTRIWTGGTEEEGRNTIYFRAPWSTFPPVVPKDWPGNFYMAERHFYFQAVEKYVGSLVSDILKVADISCGDTDVAFVHWPSRDLCEKGIKVIGISKDKVIGDIDEFVGNIIAAEMPFKIDYAIRNGKLQRGDRVLVVTYGSGFTVGMIVFTY